MRELATKLSIVFKGPTYREHERPNSFFWRILPEDVALVPDAEAPESWGRRDEWFKNFTRQNSIRDSPVSSRHTSRMQHACYACTLAPRQHGGGSLRAASADRRF